MSVTVVIVDDDPVVREDLCNLLYQYDDIEVIGVSDGMKTSFDSVEKLNPDLLLMDGVLFGRDGLALIRKIQSSGCQPRAIALVSVDSEDHLRQALNAGARGYLLKSDARQRLANIIRAVHRGEVHICTVYGSRVIDPHQREEKDTTKTEIILSDQEIQLLGLLAKGATTGEMAHELCLSERTVKRRIRNIRKRLQAHNRAEIVAKAHELSLL